MSLTPGTTVGPYEIVVLLGVGGMGEVYRARDGRLHRDVAIKVLPPEVSANADRLARFDREARLLAALNHPNIAAIYGLEETAHGRALVLELVEGPTLADRLADGPLPISDALTIARQIAHAVEAAHERGIVHRDLKPANIKADADGRVKVLDFGLAAEAGVFGQLNRSTSAQITMPATREGFIFGTPPYMSPEQVRGQQVDKRSDIWSYGCVLYEMLTGRYAFSGETASDTIAAILTATPNWDLLPASTSPELRRLLGRCLEKDRTQRLRDMGKARAELDVIERTAGGSAPASSAGLRAPAVGPNESVAVVAVNDRADLDYLSDGIAEALTYRLTAVPGLRVAPWAMVLRIRSKDQDFAATARELGVRTLLIVRLTTREDTHRIHAEWFDPIEMTHLWGAQYSRHTDDVFRLEDEIAVDVAQRMRPDLNSDAMGGLRKQSTNSGRAYKSYLQGKHLWNKRTADTMFRAIQYYRRALDEDATFALALTGIAESYIALGTFLFLSPADSIRHARAAAQQALAIDPGLGEARGLLAVVHALYDWDWELADREFAESIAIAPKYTVTRQWSGFSLCARRRFADGRRLLQSAIDLDPLAPMPTVQLASALYLERQYEAAIELCQQVLKLEPQFWAASLFLGQCHDVCGRASEAISWLRTANGLSADNPLAVASLGHALARSGQSDAAAALISDLERRSANEYVPRYAFALICAGMGRDDDALRHLEEACDERSSAVALWLGAEPRLDGLRSHRRFQELATRVGVA